MVVSVVSMQYNSVLDRWTDSIPRYTYVLHMHRELKPIYS